MIVVRAATAHEIPERPPIQLTAGQRVRVGARDTTWPAFVFITSSNGTGWVPARHVENGPDDPDGGVMLACYDTTELPTETGEELTVLAADELSGWTWLRNAAGREGWVPNQTLDRRGSLGRRDQPA